VILNAEESTVDWNRLIWLAEKHRVIRPLGLTLRYLHESFEAPVPEVGSADPSETTAVAH